MNPALAAATGVLIGGAFVAALVRAALVGLAALIATIDVRRER